MGIAFLFVLGLCLGSFVNALTWRLYTGKDWVRARSQCPDCSHRLSATDLVPVFGWLLLRGRCRYCKKPISKQYPLMELLGGGWFASSYYFWPANLDSVGNDALFVGWLLASVGLLALLVYDHKWMILPSKIIYSSLLLAVIARIIYLFYSSNLEHDLLAWLLSLLVASGIFYLLHEISKGQWIGFGDVRLGLLTGTLLATPEKSLLMIFIASILGSIFAIPVVLAKKKVLSVRFAYGPFLIVATWFVMLFGQQVIDWYLNTLQ